jgi:hypothetical protein
VGYQVVQVADEPVPVARARPQATPTRPASPLGYRLIQVAEEKSPGRRPAAAARLPKQPCRRKAERPPLWAPVAAGGFLLLAFVVVVAAVCVAGTQPSAPTTTVNFAPPPAVAFAGPPAFPAAPQVIIPEAAPGDAVAENADARAAAPAADKARPGGPGLAVADGCKDGRCGAPPGGRETFGTAVAFARNPQEAARAAAAERKLTFVLHVSGNFEDNRFT